MKQPERDNRLKKYGGWAMNISDAEAEKIVHGYGNIASLFKDIIENARIDGASDFKIFMKLILPLSFPALAAFSIFQFLWTWNDLLVAKVFLIDSSGQTEVMTSKLVELLGSRGGNWEILATSAFVSIVVPLIVFFTLQKYLVRGLLTGAIK